MKCLKRQAQKWNFLPNADKEEITKEYDISLLESIDDCKPYDAVVVAVKHESFAETINLERVKLIQNNACPVLIDVRGLYNRKDAIKQGFIYWQL